MIRIAALVVSILLSPPPPETVREAVRAIREDGSYQQRIPPPRPAPANVSPRDPSGDRRARGSPAGDGEEDDGTVPGGHRRRPRRTARAGDPRDPADVESAGPSFVPGDLVKAILWVVVGVVVAAILVLLVRAFLSRSRERSGAAAGAPPAGPDPARPVPAIAFDDADRLAREGRFAEAIHVLLLRTLTALAARGDGLAASLTSREVVRDAPLTAESRAALAGLVESVEVSRFGSVVPDAAEYAASRARFERLAVARPAPAGAA